MDELYLQRRRTLLPHALAALYALALIYASLQPFGAWLPPEPGKSTIARKTVLRHRVGLSPIPKLVVLQAADDRKQQG